MVKNILKLEGAQELTKVEQKSIRGAGLLRCFGHEIIICCPGPDSEEYCACAPKGTPCQLW